MSQLMHFASIQDSCPDATKAEEEVEATATEATAKQSKAKQKQVPKSPVT